MTVKYLVAGSVQGVGFRYFVARRATDLRLAGWTRNLPDGRVEVVARGDLDRLMRLEAALTTGPSRAKVTSVEKCEISDEVADVNSFEIT